MSQATEIEEVTYTVAEVAKMLRMGRNKVYEEVAAGRIPSIRFGGKILVPKRPLHRMLDGEAA